MARVLSLATVIGLLAASAVAFAITEGAKLTRSPIYGTSVTRPVFSPKARDAADRLAHLHFRLRTGQRITVWIEDRHGTNVRTLLSTRSEKRGASIDLDWDGFGDNGLLQPEGVYKPVVKLQHSHLTTVLPNPIRIDETPPRITVPHPLHPVLSPDGDGHRDLFRVHYRISERAHAILEVRVGSKTVRVEYTHGEKPTGTLEWNGKVDRRALPHGTYLLSASAKDVAGNVSKPFPFAVANIRYVALGRKRVVVSPGRRFAIRVSADAPSVRWKLRGRTGVARTGTLHFTAPRASGVFFLYVFVGDHAARCAVVVA